MTTDSMRQVMADDLAIPPMDLEDLFQYVSVVQTTNVDTGEIAHADIIVDVAFQSEMFTTVEIAGAMGSLSVSDQKFLIPAVMLVAAGVTPKENDLVNFQGKVYHVFYMRMDDDQNLWIIGARP